MNTKRKTAIAVGGLYILGTAAGILCFILTSPILEGPDYLIKISANENQLILGALLMLLMGLALAMVSVVLYPILKIYNETLALGYVVFRGALETFTYIALVICWLLLVSTSQLYGQAGPLQAATFQAFGSLLKEAEEIIFSTITEIIFPLGALLLYYLLYETKLVPRWISGWGLVAAILYLAAGLGNMFALINPAGTIHTFLVLPMALQEMVLAVWLIVKGFNPPALSIGSAKADIAVQMSLSK